MNRHLTYRTLNLSTNMRRHPDVDVFRIREGSELYEGITAMGHALFSQESGERAEAFEAFREGLPSPSDERGRLRFDYAALVPRTGEVKIGATYVHTDGGESHRVIKLGKTPHPEPFLPSGGRIVMHHFHA